MSPALHAARLGLSRGWTEFRQTLTSPQDLGTSVFWAILLLGVLVFQRGSTVEGAPISLAMSTLPGMLGLQLFIGGFNGAAGYVTIEREDGTLLRAKAVPHGMVGYVIGRVVSVALSAVLGLVIVVVPGLLLVPELLAIDAVGWLTLVWVVVLGLLATLPVGAAVGSLAKNPNALFGLVLLPMFGLAAISGVFYPIAALPGWVQTVAQGFPVYWLGLGMRSAFLPDAAAAVEIAASWRTLPTVGVLTAWAVVGLVVAPVVLRRMARRESGSAMAERRQAALSRVG